MTFITRQGQWQRTVLRLVFFGTVASCNSDSSPSNGVAAPSSGGTASVEIVSGQGQSGAEYVQLPIAIAVRALDSLGRPVSGQLVSFRVLSGAGAVYAGASITGADGLAQDRWTLGPAPSAFYVDSQVVETRAVSNVTGQPILPARFRAVSFTLVRQTRIHAINQTSNSIAIQILMIGATLQYTGLSNQGSLDPAGSPTGNRGTLCFASGNVHAQRSFTILGTVPGSASDHQLQQLSQPGAARNAWADSMARGLLTVDQFKTRMGADLLASSSTFEPVPAGVAEGDTVRWTWLASGGTTDPTLTPADAACHGGF